MRFDFRTALLVFIILSIFIIVGNTVISLSFVRSITQSLSSVPLQKMYGLNVSLRKDGNTEVKELKEENARLQKQLVDFQKLKKDNEALRSQYENSKVDKKNLLPVSVIGFTGAYNNPSKLIIDKGSNNGLQKGMSVIYNNSLVGYIDVAYENYSRILLPTTSAFTTVGKTLDTQAAGIVEGQEDFILFRNVVITDSLKEGDILVTQGDINENGLGIYPDIIIGKVEHINKKENSPFQNAMIKPVLNYSTLTTVFVVLTQ